MHYKAYMYVRSRQLLLRGGRREAASKAGNDDQRQDGHPEHGHPDGAPPDGVPRHPELRRRLSKPERDHGSEDPIVHVHERLLAVVPEEQPAAGHPEEDEGQRRRGFDDAAKDQRPRQLLGVA